MWLIWTIFDGGGVRAGGAGVAESTESVEAPAGQEIGPGPALTEQPLDLTSGGALTSPTQDPDSDTGSASIPALSSTSTTLSETASLPERIPQSAALTATSTAPGTTSPSPTPRPRRTRESYEMYGDIDNLDDDDECYVMPGRKIHMTNDGENYESLELLEKEIVATVFSSLLAISKLRIAHHGEYSVYSGVNAEFGCLLHDGETFLSEVQKEHLTVVRGILAAENVNPEKYEEYGLLTDLTLVKTGSHISCYLQSPTSALLGPDVCEETINRLAEELAFPNQKININDLPSDIAFVYILPDGRLQTNPPTHVICQQSLFADNIDSDSLKRNLDKIFEYLKRLDTALNIKLFENLRNDFHDCGVNLNQKENITEMELENCRYLNEYVLTTRAKRQIDVFKLQTGSLTDEGIDADLVNSNFDKIEQTLRKFSKRIISLQSIAHYDNIQLHDASVGLSTLEKSLYSLELRRTVQRVIRGWGRRLDGLRRLVVRDQRNLIMKLDLFEKSIISLARGFSVCLYGKCGDIKNVLIQTEEAGVRISFKSNNIKSSDQLRLNCRMIDNKIKLFHLSTVRQVNRTHIEIIGHQMKIGVDCLKTGDHCPDLWERPADQKDLIENSLYIRRGKSLQTLLTCSSPSKFIEITEHGERADVCSATEKVISLPFITPGGAVIAHHSQLNHLLSTSPYHVRLHQDLGHSLHQGEPPGAWRELSEILSQTWKKIYSTDRINIAHGGLFGGASTAFLISAILGCCGIYCKMCFEKRKQQTVIRLEAGDPADKTEDDSEEKDGDDQDQSSPPSSTSSVSPDQQKTAWQMIKKNYWQKYLAGKEAEEEADRHRDRKVIFDGDSRVEISLQPELDQERQQRTQSLNRLPGRHSSGQLQLLASPDYSLDLSPLGALPAPPPSRPQSLTGLLHGPLRTIQRTPSRASFQRNIERKLRKVQPEDTGTTGPLHRIFPSLSQPHHAPRHPHLQRHGGPPGCRDK